MPYTNNTALYKAGHPPLPLQSSYLLRSAFQADDLSLHQHLAEIVKHGLVKIVLGAKLNTLVF